MKISMVMPTHNRAKYIPIAIRCFLQQTFPSFEKEPEKELIIIDDGSEEIQVPRDERIFHIVLAKRQTTGTKRNIGIEEATGDIVASLDDDDWSHPHRLEDQVNRLLISSKFVTGYNATILFEESTRKLYKNCGGPPYLASGTSQCYWRIWGQMHPFPDASYGEDSYFARVARLADQLAIADPGKMMVARKHDGNTDPYDVDRLQKLNSEDISLDFFLANDAPIKDEKFMYEPHICSPACRAELQMQRAKPVVDYRTHRIPEIPLR